MVINRLNKRITFMQLKDKDENGVPFENELGNNIQKLMPYKKVWASVDPTKSDEIIEVERKKDTLYYTVFVKYDSNITGSMVINYQDKKLEIIGPTMNNREENLLQI
jgi:SPP1 family predicted phage head-tail adaptor